MVSHIHTQSVIKRLTSMLPRRCQTSSIVYHRLCFSNPLSLCSIIPPILLLSWLVPQPLRCSVSSWLPAPSPMYIYLLASTPSLAPLTRTVSFSSTYVILSPFSPYSSPASFLGLCFLFLLFVFFFAFVYVRFLFFDLYDIWLVSQWRARAPFDYWTVIMLCYGSYLSALTLWSTSLSVWPSK